ncbi:MAG: AI-2E family transporter [Sumerlaeia bacterium]
MENQTPDSSFFPRSIVTDPQVRRIVITIGYMLIAGGVMALLTLAWPVISTIFKVLSPFIVALVLAYVLNPAVTFFENKLRLTRVAGVTLLFLIIALIIAGFMAIVTPILVRQVETAYDSTQSFVRDKAVPWLEERLQPPPPAEEEEDRGGVFGFFARGEEEVKKGVTRLTGRDAEEGAESAEGASPVATGADVPEGVASPPPQPETDPEAATANAGRQGAGAEEPATEAADGATTLGAAAQAGEEQSIVQIIGDQIRQLLAADDASLEQLLQSAVGSEGVRTAAGTALEEGGGLVGAVFVGVVKFVSGLFGSVIFIVFVVLVTFYLLIDFDSLRGVFEVLCPDKYEVRFFDIALKVDTAVGGFIRGQITVAAIVGIMAFTGLMLLGLKQYAVLIAVIAAVGNLIPYLGPVLAAAPAIAYQLFSDAHDSVPEKLIFAGLVIGLFGLIQFIEGFILQPKVVGKNAQLHPIAVILALAAGAVFGIIGMIVAVPVACAVRVLWKEFYWDNKEDEWRDLTGKQSLDDPRSGTEALRKRQAELRAKDRGLFVSEEETNPHREVSDLAEREGESPNGGDEGKIIRED